MQIPSSAANNEYTSLYQNQSSLLASGAPSPASGDPPDQWIVVPGDRHETTLQLHGAAQVTASSFGPIFNDAPGQQPLEAFLADAGQGGAAWQASPADPRPWIEIRFNHSVSLSRITLTPLAGRYPEHRHQGRDLDGPWSGDRLIGPGGSTPEVPDAGGQQSLAPGHLGRPASTTRKRGSCRPGFAHIAIPGISVTQRWLVPADGPATPGWCRRTSSPHRCRTSSPSSRWPMTRQLFAPNSASPGLPSSPSPARPHPSNRPCWPPFSRPRVVRADTGGHAASSPFLAGPGPHQHRWAPLRDLGAGHGRCSFFATVLWPCPCVASVAPYAWGPAPTP